MAKLKLTEQQQAAVENRGGRPLVAAAQCRVRQDEGAGGAAVPIRDGGPLPYR